MSNAAATQYTGMAKTLHWLIALLLTGLLAMGFYMHDLPLSPQKLQLYSWHKWAGVTTFLLVMVRLAWRMTHRPPAFSWRMSKAQKLAAHLGHWILYLLMIAIPLSGWLMSSAKGVQTVWFGILPIPDLLEKDKALGDALAVVHMGLSWALLLMTLIHIAAAFKHHFIDKEGLLGRMLPAIFFRTQQN